jgi:putative peptidoglycan lipid II flippase
MHDTVTPVKTAAIAVALNVILNLILMWPLKLGGLALATSISATCNFLMLYLILRKRIGDPGTGRMLEFFWRIFMASGVMAIFCSAAIKLMPIERSRSSAHNLALLGLIILAGMAVFVLASLWLKVGEIRESLKWISRKR